MQVNYQIIRPNYELKFKASNQLSGNWGNGVLLTLLYGLIILLSLITVVGPFIVMPPLMVGLCICFLNLTRYGQLKVDTLFDGFKYFGSSIAILFLLLGIELLISMILVIPFSVFVISPDLGTILFLIFIPLVAALITMVILGYAMAPFIIHDIPTISVTEALRLSRQMMNGFKLKLFLLYLSFIGWFLLSACTCYIGLLWLIPYIFTSYANFYENLREAYNLPMNMSYSFYATNNMYNHYDPNYNNNFNNSYNNYGDGNSYNPVDPNTPNYYNNPFQQNTNIVQKNNDEGIDKF